MQTHITLEPVDEVPADCRVCHYDELEEEAKARVPALAADTGGDAAAAVDGPVADGFGDCDLVKYTDYYEVSIG